MKTNNIYTAKRIDELKARINNPANLWQAVELEKYGIQVYNVEEGAEYSVIVKAERDERTGRYYFITREGVRIPWSIIPRDKMITAAVDFLDRIESDHPATIESRENGVTVHHNQTADNIAEKAQALADSVAVVFGSSLPSSDMVISLEEFRNWTTWEVPTAQCNAPFFFAIRKQGTESGTREHCAIRCKMLGTPVYIIKVERAEIDLFTMSVKVVKAEEPTTPTNEPTEEATEEPTTEPTTPTMKRYRVTTTTGEKVKSLDLHSKDAAMTFYNNCRSIYQRHGFQLVDAGGNGETLCELWTREGYKDRNIELYPVTA